MRRSRDGDSECARGRRKGSWDDGNDECRRIGSVDDFEDVVCRIYPEVGKDAFLQCGDPRGWNNVQMSGLDKGGGRGDSRRRWRRNRVVTFDASIKT